MKPEASTRMGRHFSLFWTSMSVSVLGSELTTFAIPVIAAIALQATPFEMGILVACGQVPNIFMSILAGPAIDRSAKRNLLAGLDIARALMLGVVAMLAATGSLSIAALGVLAFVLGCANSTFDTGYVGYTPYLVSDANLIRANGRIEASSATAQVIGPSLGGILAGLAAPAIAAASAGIAFVVAASLMLRVPERGAPKAAGDEATGQGFRAYMHDIGTGLAYVWRLRPLRVIALSSGAFNFFSGASASIFTLFVLREVGLPAELLGLGVGLGSLGGLLGAIVAPTLDSRVGTSTLIPLSLLAAALGEILVVLAPADTLPAFLVVAGATFVAVFGVTVFIITNITVRQQVTPRERLSSVYGSMRFFTRGLLPLGALLSGIFVEVLGLQGALIAIGIGQIGVSTGCFIARKQLVVADKIGTLQQ